MDPKTNDVLVSVSDACVSDNLQELRPARVSDLPSPSIRFSHCTW